MMDQLQAVRAGPWKLYLPLENKLMSLRRNQEKSPSMCSMCDKFMAYKFLQNYILFVIEITIE
jgi:hypothetical protein